MGTQSGPGTGRGDRAAHCLILLKVPALISFRASDLTILPESGQKEEQHDEKFKAAQEHPEEGKDFGAGGEKGKGIGGAGCAEGSADVVEEAGDEAERCFRVDAVEDEEDGADKGAEGDDAKKREDGLCTFIIDGCVADAEEANGVGAVDRFEAVEDDFVENVKARGFNTAGG